MLRMLLVALLGLPLTIGVRADSPQSKTDPKPQGQRLLSGDDARKAAELEKRIGELVNADRYAEAIRAGEELLALRTNVQGIDHWQTVILKWSLAALKQVSALPKEKRGGWRQVEQSAAEARRLEQQAQYVKALPLRQERLKQCREVLGEDHPHTAQSYDNIAANLNAQGKYAEAAPLLQKALDICRKALGEDHPDTA
ncbi:MAG: tetratricopeptide repeat protein, partial [Planctomycetes bacterium]|nr:tetratricopeptide repeat protein [Planctomycetota bacterium]